MTILIFDFSSALTLYIHHYSEESWRERELTVTWLPALLTIQPADAVYKKAQSHLHLLTRLSPFRVSRTMLMTFNDTIVVSIGFYAVVCRRAGSSERDKNKLNKLVKKACTVLGCPDAFVEEAGERRMLAKLTSIMDDSFHPLQGTVEALNSSHSNRLRHPQCSASTGLLFQWQTF